jgi:hypothetical protein
MVRAESISMETWKHGGAEMRIVEKTPKEAIATMTNTPKKAEKTGTTGGVQENGRTEILLSGTQRNLRIVPHALLMTEASVEAETGVLTDLWLLAVTEATMGMIASDLHVDLLLRQVMEAVAAAEAKDHDATARHLLRKMINMMLESDSTVIGWSTSDLVALEPGSARKQS